MAEQEASLGNFFLELLPCVHLADIVIPEFEGSCIDILLNVHKQVLNSLCKAFNRHGYLLKSITTGNFHGTVSKVAGTDCKAYRNSLELPLRKLEARTEGVAVVNLHAVAMSLKFSLEFVHLFEYCSVAFLVLTDDRNDDYLDRSKLRRKYESVVVSMSHDQRTHQTG